MTISPPRTGPLVCVYRATGPTDAWIVRDWLVRNDVVATVRGEALLGLLGQVPMHEAWPTVWVAPEDQARADDAMRLFNGPALVHPEWTCARCGEQSPPSFGTCWSCGTDR